MSLNLAFARLNLKPNLRLNSSSIRKFKFSALNLNQNKIHFESICKEKCFIILLITEMEMR